MRCAPCTVLPCTQYTTLCNTGYKVDCAMGFIWHNTLHNVYVHVSIYSSIHPSIHPSMYTFEHYMSLCASLSLSIYIYIYVVIVIYIYIYIYIYICIYIYAYVERERERERDSYACSHACITYSALHAAQCAMGCRGQIGPFWQLN